MAANTVVLDQVFTPTPAGETLIRTRGIFVVGSDQNSAAEQTNGAVGVGVVSEQAATVGVTAVPHFDTDSAWGGWLWHSYFAANFAFGTAVGFEPNMMQTIVIDSKAMRKIGDNERLVVVVQNSHATFGLVYYTSMRLYSKPF